MKRNRILVAFLLLEILSYIYLILQKKKDFTTVWFSILLIAIGLFSLLYFFLYKMDSELYFGTLICFIGMCSWLRLTYGISFNKFYMVYIFCFAFAHFAVFVFFRQKIHLKLFAILILQGILIAGYKFNYLKLYQVLLILISFIVFVLINLILRLKKNLRRNE